VLRVGSLRGQALARVGEVGTTRGEFRSANSFKSK
jgi:hypothetical protein